MWYQSVLTVKQAYMYLVTSVSESESTASDASVLDDKTATIQYKPGNNNTLAHYEQSRGYDQISHALSNIHDLYGWSCNLLDVISVYSLNPGKLPGHFSYKRPGYEASGHPVYGRHSPWSRLHRHSEWYLRNPCFTVNSLLCITDSFRGPNCTQTILNDPDLVDIC